jgi:type I restriction enzyme M protein
VLSNKKPAHRKGKVQLIDATQWFKPLRKNPGKKNCELAPEDIERISQTFLAFTETPESKIFPNEAFGYWKVMVERPLRLHSRHSLKAIETLRFASGDEDLRAALYDEFGDDLFTGFAKIYDVLEERLDEWGSEAFIRREVLPYTPDAWIKKEATKIGYEISFTRHFYKPQPLRPLEEIRADILAIEQEAEGLLGDLLKVGGV